jgi:hypothetical protein
MGKEIKLCIIEGCEGIQYAKSYCKKHHTAYYRYGDPLKLKTRPRLKYEESHKNINGVEHKLCKDCNQWFIMDNNNFPNDNSSKDGFKPYCRKCAGKRTMKWAKANPEKRDRIRDKHFKSDKYKQYQSEYRKKPNIQKKIKEWRENNKDKINEGINFKMKNHKHKITEREWSACKRYFDNACAYCGLTESDHYDIYGQQINQEHVENRGANDLSNCVPSCKSCNSSKNVKDFEEWYNLNNPIYNEERMNKIYIWLETEHKKYIEL